jgi:hypothetical protein
MQAVHPTSPDRLAGHERSGHTFICSEWPADAFGKMLAVLSVVEDDPGWLYRNAGSRKTGSVWEFALPAALTFSSSRQSPVQAGSRAAGAGVE